MLDFFPRSGLTDRFLYMDLSCLIFPSIGVLLSRFVLGHFVNLSPNISLSIVRILFQNTHITFAPAI